MLKDTTVCTKYFTLHSNEVERYEGLPIRLRSCAGKAFGGISSCGQCLSPLLTTGRERLWIRHLKMGIRVKQNMELDSDVICHLHLSECMNMRVLPVAYV